MWLRQSRALRSHGELKLEMRRIIVEPNGLSLKICYPKHIENPDNKEYFIKRYFGYPKYSGFEGALKAARELRNKYEEKYCLKTDLWNEVTGVSCHYRYIAGRNHIHCAWRASWRQTINGKRVSRSKTYCFKFDDAESEKKAYQNAVKKRKEMYSAHY